MGLALFAGISSPAFAKETPPSDISISEVRLGHLIDQTVTISDINSNASVTVRISGCEESWVDNEKFLMIKSRTGNYFVIRSSRFSYYYSQSHDWDYTIQRITQDGALCTIN